MERKIFIFKNVHLFQMGCREFSCEAISHLEEISPDGIDAMAETGSVAVILPTTAYILRLRPPPVREMIDRGVIVALGTDFNPNAFCLTMVMIVSVYAAEILLKKYSWETKVLFLPFFGHNFGGRNATKNKPKTHA